MDAADGNEHACTFLFKIDSTNVVVSADGHEYERNGVVRKYPYCDYEYRGQGDWNYAYCADALEVEDLGR